MRFELWQLTAAILVMSMQAGFLLLEAGRVRTRNTINVAQKNAADLAVCWVIFLAVGFWFAFGEQSPLYQSPASLSAGTTFLYQLGFCSAAATIVSGAVAERMRFNAYLMLTVVMAGVIYPLAVWLVWGNALMPDRSAPLAELGFQDFAGATVVHGVAAWTALAAVLKLGPRIDRYDENGVRQELPGHNPVLSMLGTLILVFGWLGFNCGAIAPTDPSFVQGLINTLGAAAAGGLLGMFVGYKLDDEIFNPNRIMDGTLSGLVAITACVPYASTWQAMLLGGIAALIAALAVDWLEHRCKLDDPLGVIAVHGVAGIVGTLTIAMLLPAEMLVASSRWAQFGVQLLGCLTVGALGFVLTTLALNCLSKVSTLRVSADDEKLGLNFTEHGTALDASKLRAALQNSIADTGRFGDAVSPALAPHQDDSEIAVALTKLLDRHAEATATVAQQAARFRQFAATTNEILWETDSELRLRSLIISESSVYANITIHCSGMNLFDVFQPISNEQQINDSRIIDKRPLEKFEARYVCSETNNEYLFIVSGVPYYDAENQFQGYRGGASDVTQQKLAEERAVFLAHHDELTGLLNRRAMVALLEEQRNASSPVAIAVIDLDGFKDINDKHGHQAGDHVLCGIAKRLRTGVRGEDRVFRMGGDEFVAVLDGFGEGDPRPDAMAWCTRIIDSLSDPFLIDGERLSVGASIGISMFPDDSEDFQNLIRFADLALYEAKAQGKGITVEYRTEMAETQRAEHQLESELLLAIERREFFVVYQPKLDLQSGELSGCEALVRWRHPTRGVLAPIEFLKTMENLGLIAQLGEFVLNEACLAAANWEREDIHVSVNVSPSQLDDASFCDTVKLALRETGLPAHRLELEITEESLVKDYRNTIETLTTLRELDVLIAVDDFGCGYTSLQYLYQFPVTRLKIDKSFVRNLMQDERARDIARSIIRMGQDIELQITAEGVENKTHLNTLKSWGCDEAQGYLIAKPMEEMEFRQHWLEEQEQPIISNS